MPRRRNRWEEIPVLLNFFTEGFARLYGSPVVSPSQRLVAACLEYPWPGNVRELQSFTQRFLIQRDEERSLQELQKSGKVMTGNSAAATPPGETSLTNLKKIGRQVNDTA